MTQPQAETRSPLSDMEQLPLTRLHVRVLFVCALGFSFDLFEIALGSALAAVFSSSTHTVPTGQLVWLLSSVYIGAVVGAPTLGWAAERLGRKRVLAATLLFLSAASAAAALSPNVWWLTAARGLSGLALGAFPPLMFAYLTDVLPARDRGKCLMLVVAFASLGAPLGVFVLRAAQAHQILGVEGWRLALLCGGIGAGVAGSLMLRLFESPRWLCLRDRHSEAAIIVANLSASPRFRRRASVRLAATSDRGPAAQGSLIALPAAPMSRAKFGALALVYLLSPWSTVAFPLLIGAVMVERGLGLQQSLLFVALSSFGPALGALFGAPVLDRFERRTVLCTMALAMILCCIWLNVSVSAWSLLSSIASFSFAASIYISALSIYGAELFPTRHRAVMTSSAWAFNRIGAASAPIVLVPLLRVHGETAMLQVIGSTLLISAALFLILPAGFARRSVR